MTRPPFFNRNSLAIMAAIVLIASCTNADTDKTSEGNPTTDTTQTNVAQTFKEPAVAGITEGRLDTLWTDSSSFVKLANRKKVFVFIFGEGDTLTLHGWDAKGLMGDEFDSLPEIRLQKGRASNYSYGPGTYFSNVVLKGAVAEIKRLLRKEHAQYVLFAPKKIGEHIYYEIFISKENPSLVKDQMFAPIPTNIIANPSPPK